MSKICKYAGDPTDEYCKNCDGCTMEVDGNSIPCTECAGYEAGENETDINMNDFDELVNYFNYVFNEDVEAYNFTICGIIDTIINHSNKDFIASQEGYEGYTNE